MPTPPPHRLPWPTAYVAAHAAAALACCTTPLLDLLGYESALAVALVSTLLAPGLGVAAARSYGPLAAGGRAAGGALLGFAVALGIVWAHGRWVGPCDELSGLLFWLLLPGLGGLYAAALGAAAGQLPLAQARPVFARLLAAGLGCWPLFYALGQLYAEPSIRAYSHAFGYFAGSLFDEDIVVGAPLLWFRLRTALRLTSLLLLLAWAGSRRQAMPLVPGPQGPKHALGPAWSRLLPGPWLRQAGPLVLLGCGWLLLDGLAAAHDGTAGDRTALLAALPYEIRRPLPPCAAGELRAPAQTGPAIVVHLPKDVPDALAERIADDHLYRFARLAAQLAPARLGSEPLAAGPAEPTGPTCPAYLAPLFARDLHSFVFASAADKARVVGSEQTLITKAWRGEMYLHGLDDAHPMLAHELAHIALAGFALGPLHLPARARLLPDIPLLEGMAVALSPDATSLGLTQTIVNMRSLGLGAPLAALFGGDAIRAMRSFWGESPERVYLQAGHFLQYVQRTYGPEKLLALYARGDFAQVLGVPAAQVVAAYEATLAGAAPPLATALERVRSDLRRPSVFVRRCPHQSAAWRREMQTADSWQRVALARRLLALAPEAVEARLTLARGLFALNRQHPTLAPQARAEAEQLLANLRPAGRRGEPGSAPAQSALARAQICDALGLWSSERGGSEGVAAAQALYAEGLALPVAPVWHRLFAARQWALTLPDVERAAASALLGAPGPTLASELALAAYIGRSPAAPGAAMARYLLARRLLLARDDAAGIAMAPEPALLPTGALRRELYQQLVSAHVRLAQWSQAKAQLAALAAMPLPADERSWCTDLAQRIAWQVDAQPTGLTR